MTGLATLASRLFRLTLVVGKGGVGKTTCSVELATHLAAHDHRTLLISTDPAGTLAEALGHELSAEAREIPGNPRLQARQLSAPVERARFLERWRDVIVQILDRGTYLDSDDISGLVDTALPGADEVFALLALAELDGDSSYDRIVVDTAPTGHTLHLLALPATFQALIALLDSMQEKHRFMVQALTHQYAPDLADAFIEQMGAAIASLSGSLADRQRTGAVLVTRAEPVVVAETERYARALTDAGINITALVLNAVPAGDDLHTLSMFAHVAPEVERFVVGYQLSVDDTPSRSSADTAQRSSALQSHTAAAASKARKLAAPTPASVLHSPLPFTIVAGKGGVGKTTVSCALAIAAADSGARVLLVSTDPAPSIADALGFPVGDEEAEVPGAPGLTARQVDATAAFTRLREEYQSRIDDLFASLMSRGIQVAHDQAILHDLLSLAPPGVDELYALAFLGEVVPQGSFDTVIVDPAPTGHLLRLLEMPPLALEWSHHLLRLMLKYREVTGLGDAAEQLLAFARRTRALGELLRDPGRSGAVVVTLDEPLVRAETRRLVDALRALQMNVVAVLWNRTSAAPLPPARDVGQLVARPVSPPPTGVDALRAWSATWTELPAPNG